MHLLELVVIRCLCDGCEMKNGVELFIPELQMPVDRRQVLRDEIATITGEILKITRAEIVNYRQTRVWESFLQRQCEIRADEAGATGDNKVQARVHKKGVVAGSIK